MRKLQLCICLFVAVGAITGSLAFWTDPSGSSMGMDGLLPYFQKLPLADILFKDYKWSGLALICVNGIPNIMSAFLLLKKKQLGDIISFLAGIILILWIIFELYIMPLYPIHIIFLTIGILQTAVGLYICHKS